MLVSSEPLTISVCIMFGGYTTNHIPGNKSQQLSEYRLSGKKVLLFIGVLGVVLKTTNKGRSLKNFPLFFYQIVYRTVMVTNSDNEVHGRLATSA